MRFAEALKALNAMKVAGVVDEYAIAGAMAVGFWAEPVATYDLDVLVVMSPPTGRVVTLDNLYAWAASRGFFSKDEHIVIAGVPTQIVPSPGPLSDEAIREAAELDYEGIPVRVVRPEYLIALFNVPEARTAKRRERAAALLEAPDLNRQRLDAILKRYGIEL